MKSKLILNIFLCLLMASSSAAAQRKRQPARQTPKPTKQTPQPAEQPSKPESVNDRASYTIGLNLGRSLKSNNAPVNQDRIIQGLRDGLTGSSILTDAEIQAAMQEFQKQLMTAAEAKTKIVAEKNKLEGDAFLAANKNKPGVQTTASGLQYVMLVEGSGANPKPTDEVTIHYTGTLIDGTTFDSSRERGTPATFRVNQVIAGFSEGLQLLKPGGKINIYLPSALAYGERGAGDQIGPNAVLIFEIELLSVQAKP
jgi:FKBP-type peptidyl-prolyl cis-trans isomerase FklB